jgi:hypothetical protein
MKRTVFAVRSGRTGLAAVAAFVAALLTGLLALAPSASACGGGCGGHKRPHHDHDWVPQVELEADCASDTEWDIWFTVETWRETDEVQLGNSRVEMAYQVRDAEGHESAFIAVPWQPSYVFAPPDYWFDDMFILPMDGSTEIRMRAIVVGAWDDGAAPGEELYSPWVGLPAKCGCGGDKPTTTTVPETTTTIPETTTTTEPETATTTEPEAPTTTEPEAPTTTVAVAQQTLPVTGSLSGPLAMIAVAFLAAGLFLVRMARTA